MLLKHIYLYLNLNEYPDELVTSFGFRTRYICNFLERRLGKLKFQAEGFNKICVQGREVSEASCPILPENAVVPSVRFDHDGYQLLGPDEHHEFFIGMLCEGLDKCARYHDIPLVELMEAMEEFRSIGYKNEWVHQSKSFRSAGVHVSLLCSLDAERFVLVLKLERHGVVVYEREILETKPDEIIFSYRFKEVVLDGDSVVVKDRFGRPIFSMELGSLC